MPTSPPDAAVPHLKTVRRGDRVWLYYRRGGFTWSLRGPLGSTHFLEDYGRIHSAYGTLPVKAAGARLGTVELAIREYLVHADFLQLSPTTRENYRRILDGFRTAFGPLLLDGMTATWWETYRGKHVAMPNTWNALRSLMRIVIRLYRIAHPGQLAENPLDTVRRLKVDKSSQNRPWPIETVLVPVVRAATPQFRALLVGYLLTSQRGGDVTTWRRRQYDPKARTLTMEQGKSETSMVLHVPSWLADVWGDEGDADDMLFRTPRGVAWTLTNAQDTLRVLLLNLRMPRYTLHGLRATGPVALKLMGFDIRQIMYLLGHTTEATTEIYLRGAASYNTVRQAQEQMAEIFGPALEAAFVGANTSRAAGATGRPRKVLATGVETGNSRERITS